MTRPERLAIFIGILAIVVRLIGINQPYIGEWSWRQSDVAAIARNYFVGGFHFARPQIDWAGDQPGYVGTEFPILPFVAAICYEFLGVHEWIGRIQAVILFAISLPFFYLIVRKVFGESAATWALFFCSFAPLGIMASRSFMPDVPSLALSLIGLYFFQRWIDSDARLGSRSFILAAVAISLSILVKLPNAIIGAPLACLAFYAPASSAKVVPRYRLTQSGGVQRFRKPPLRLGAAFQRFDLWLFAAIALLPAAVWYWHGYQISLRFYPYHFFGAGGVRTVSASDYWRIARWIFTSTLTPVLFLLGGVGAFVGKSNARARLFYWWLGSMVLFFVVVGYGNRHQWYQLPLVPIAAAFGGAACGFVTERISRREIKIALAVLIAVGFGWSSFVYAKDFYKPIGASLRAAGLALKEITPSNSLIAAADNGDPTVLYYAERKGWHVLEKDGIYYGEPIDGASAITELDGLREKGATYFVLTANTSWWLENYPDLRQYLENTAMLADASSEFRIYQFSPVSK
jgi:4-amino-4-deoxy-L-arabinose transferase-like glycosyltransferase